MDLPLPGLNGREMLMAMREDMAPHEQPVIILSGLDYDFSVQDIHELGVHAFVSKPMDITDLEAVARIVLAFWAGLVLRPVSADVSSSSGRRPRR
jgi:DNA-binding response OmpR family regulator